MNEQALQDSFSLFASQGYTGNIEDFKELISTNDQAFNDAYSLFSSGGYSGDKSQFAGLVGVDKVGKTDDSAVADPNVESEESDTGSNLEAGLSGQQSSSILDFFSGIKDDIKSRIKDEEVEAPADASTGYFIGRGISESPTGFFQAAKYGAPGFLSTAYNLTVGGLADLQDMMDVLKGGLAMRIEKGKFSLSPEENAQAKELGLALGKARRAGLGSIGAASGLDTEKIKDTEKKLQENLPQYETTISEEMAKGADADWSTIAGRIVEGSLTSAPYTLMSLNPYTAAYMGLSISGDKFMEEVEENPERAHWKLIGNAGTTGGIEMLDALITRRLLKAKGLLGKGKNTEQAVKNMNKSLSRKALGILGIGAKEGATEAGQAILTKINDYLWLGDLPGQDEQGKITEKGFIKTLYEVADEAIIGAFTGGGVSTIAQAVQGNKVLEDRAKSLLTPDSVKSELIDLQKQHAERQLEIAKAVKEGNNRRAGALRNINEKLAVQINRTAMTSSLVLDNLTKEELIQYAKNVDQMGALKQGGNVDSNIQSDINGLQDANNKIFQEALQRNFGENMSFAQAAAGQLGLDTTIANDINEFNELVGSKKGKLIKDKDGIAGAFIGDGKIIINKTTALNQGDVTVGSHEILHPILNAMIGDAKAQQKIVEDFKKTLNRRERNWTENEIKRKLGDDIVGTPTYYTEYINIFSEGLVNENVNFDSNVFEKIKDFLTKLYKGAGFDNIDFKTGRGVYNFMKAYGDSVKTGKLSEEALSALDTQKIAEAKAVGDQQLSKTQLEGVKKRLSDIPAAEVESRASVNKISAELPAMIGTQINNRFANLDPSTREEFTFDVLEKILRPNKQGVNKDLQWDGRGDLYGFLNGRIGLRIRDAVREDYNRPEAERMYVGRIDAKQLEDLTREPSTEPTVETTPKKKTTEESVQRGQAKFSELDVVDETLVNDIKSEIEKEIRVRAQKGTLSEMIGVKKGRETYMVTWLENYINKQLFKKLSKKLGAIGERNGETVIPPAYIDFLQDAKTFDIITKALPIKSIKKSYGKLFEIERIGREETAEGNPIFRIKKIDKPKFFKYFVDGKKSTILERQKQLFREILTPIAKQAVADYATPENLAKLNEIKELAPDASLDVQADIIMESQLMNLQDQLDRYKGEEKTFDIIQFSRNVNAQQKNNIRNALAPLLETTSNNDFKGSVIIDILNGLDNVKTFKDLANLVWNAGNTTLSVTSLRTYRAELLSLLAKRLNYTDTVKFLISAINAHQKVYKYQQKVIGYDYSLANFKSDFAGAKGNKNKAKVAEDFLKYISRSIRTLKINDITKNSDVYNKIIKEILSDPSKYGITLEIDKDKNRSYILRDGIRLQGLADITRIKSDFAGNVGLMNGEALEVREWLLNEAKKAQANKDVDSFIGLLSLMSADQRGVIRKMNNAGFAFNNLKVSDAVLEHETEAVEVFEEWKKFAEGKISEQQLNKFLDGAKVNLVSKGFDNLLKKIQKETGARGKARYADPRAKAYLNKSKNNITQFSRSLPFPDQYDMVDVVARALYPKETRVDAVIGGGVKPFEALPKELQRKVYQEMVDHKLTVEGIQFSQQNLSNVNKAKQMSARPDAPNKGISVWDFDDTLATTKSNVLYTLPDGTKGKINATEFALKAGELEAQGAEFDFSEFSKVMEGAKGPMFDKAIARNKKFGNDNVFILTARPANSKYAIHNFLKGIGLDIKLENIVGLGDGTAKAKAQWIIGKVAEGYNDFYFADDAYKNVKAVQEVLEQSDVKSKVHQAKVQFSQNLNKEFNNIIQDATGIAADKEISGAKAKALARGKGRFKFFIPPSADDFAGLLYKLLGKGKKGEQQQAWFKQALFDPFAKAMREFESYKQNVATIVKALKKDIKNIPAGLKKINESGFTNETAVRVYLWVKNGHKEALMAGKTVNLTKEDIKELLNIVESNPDLKDFADQMDAVLDGYPEPQNDWLAGTITTDAINMVNTIKRAEFLAEWQQNADAVFTQENINKLKAAYGESYTEALQDMLYRMKTGRNRPYGANKLTNNFMNWVNDSVGTIMFFNTRSALLQTLSTVNFINWGDNNPMAAAKAFANQKQFWADFAMLFNSDFLKQRRSGLKNDVNADDIASAAETSTNKVKAALSSILKMGFLPTQIADSFAISMGGASFVRNRINTYIKQGMTKQEAQEQAFLDFQEIAEETQQSSRPDRISQQQASPLGRIILAFANTPMQYMRLTKKAFLDLKNGRGDAKTNITKMAYYMAVQNVIFSALQSALFSSLFEDEDEEELNDKQLRVANSMLDSILRGVGIYGAIAATAKNIVLEIDRQSKKDRPDFTVAAQRALSISPPIDSKMRKLMSAARAFSYKTTREKMVGYGLDNPAYYAVGQIVSATTNVPLDRAIRKADNIRVAMDNDTKYWQSVALLLGYSQWDVGLVETSKDKKKKSKWGSTTKWKKSSKKWGKKKKKE